MKKTLLLIFFIPAFLSAGAQKNLLDNEDVLDEIYSCITATYSFDFDRARELLIPVEEYTPSHPAVKFLKAFILYWEFYPIVPGHPREEEFLRIIEDCIIDSEKWVQKSEGNIEAVFFDLFSRAFYAMYWADNGKPGKIFPHMNTMYKNTMKGFDMKDRFNEFYFTTGLYNYYIEAYPEKHPAFKPMVIFFQEGDRSLGLDQLQYCAENAIFLRVEAKFFLSLIYINYELDIKKASSYAAELYNEFPRNSYYAGRYLELLLFNRKYFLAPIILKNISKWDDPFSRMIYHLYKGYFTEKSEKKPEAAKRQYEKALEISEQFADFTDTYNAIAYMGLGRYHEKKGNSSLASRYFRKANGLTNYEYILSDR